MVISNHPFRPATNGFNPTSNLGLGGLHFVGVASHVYPITPGASSRRLLVVGF